MALFFRSDGGRTEEEWREARHQMVLGQIRGRGITDERVLAAMVDMPRHRFVPQRYRHRSCEDSPISIGFRQTISQPYIVALMLESLHLSGTERVLEIGTGCGYQTALLANLAREVVSIERIPSLAKRAARTLSELGIGGISIIQGDGTEGAADHAPFDGIVVTAASPRVPQPLQEQLADGGRLVIPVGERHEQQLISLQRVGQEFKQAQICPCRFVPLIGRHGFP